MKSLFIIPARGGSKGVPNKNIRYFNGKPLVNYSVELARNFAADEDICLSTDSDQIIIEVEQTGLIVHFKRPQELSTDEAGTYEVILHAISHFEKLGRAYDNIVLLQPTSPLRQKYQVQKCLELYNPSLDMVTSVKESKANPYYNLFEENKNGFLTKSKESEFIRRQDCPTVYEYNGAVYVINVKSLKKSPMHKFERVVKYVMDEKSSVDIDTELDWRFAEILHRDLIAS